MQIKRFQGEQKIVCDIISSISLLLHISLFELIEVDELGCPPVGLFVGPTDLFFVEL